MTADNVIRHPARIARVDRDAYWIESAAGEMRAELTGKLRFFTDSSQDLPCVGDRVLAQFEEGGDLAVIHEVLPRKTFLRRRAAGKDVEFQMIAANVDTAFIVQALEGDFNIRRLERYLVAAADGGVEPVIVLTKTDLLNANQIQEKIQMIRESGIQARIVSLSNVTGQGIADLRDLLQPGRTYCILGSSGVGKTTLVNRLLGDDAFETAPVRAGDQKGRHTTTRRQMITLENGAVLVDTPGMRELGLMASESSVDETFADVQAFARLCRFKDCTHTRETGCAVQAALENGSLSEDRYNSYVKLTKEVRRNAASHAEKRKKDREFGRMVKTTLEHIKKRDDL